MIFHMYIYISKHITIYIYIFISNCIFGKDMISFHILYTYASIYDMVLENKRVDWKEHDLNFRDKKC